MSTRQAVVVLLAGVIVAAGGRPSQAGARPVGRGEPPEVLKLAGPSVIAQYIRDRFNIPSSTKITSTPLRATPFPPFYESSVVADDGREKHPGTVYISEDGRCFVMGNLFAMKTVSREETARKVREIERIPATTRVSVGPFTASAYPGLLWAAVTASQGKEKRSQRFFVTRNSRVGVLGLVVPFRRDFVERLISTRNQPSVGPVDAPVTLVEYADLECPSCALLHKLLRDQILHAYGTKARVVFKEFPLPEHKWAETAAVANECAGQMDPKAFFNYRSLIFEQQASIKPETARAQLLKLAEQSGVDRRRLAACMDSKATLPRIELARREAEVLGITSTPTLFVNGRPVVGAPSAPKLAMIVDEALAQAPRR